MNRIFIDTAFIVALVNQKDYYHGQATELSQKFENTHMLITDAVLLEIGNALAKEYKTAAVEIIKAIRFSDEVEIIELNSYLFLKGFNLYEKYKDKAWGMVDCISFVVMWENKITDVLAIDDHFRQAGFNLLMQR